MLVTLYNVLSALIGVNVIFSFAISALKFDLIVGFVTLGFVFLDLTVTLHLYVFLLYFAFIVAVPQLIPLTSPLLFTVATFYCLMTILLQTHHLLIGNHQLL